jgi:hypothetical protein
MHITNFPVHLSNGFITIGQHEDHSEYTFIESGFWKLELRPDAGVLK